MSSEPMTMDQAQALVEVDADLEDAIRRVATLDFSMLRRKLAEEDGWTREQCEEVEALYRQFLALNIRYPNQKLCPTGPIDHFWHAHILDTIAYAHDCSELFGGMLHHYPYFGMRGPTDRADLEQAFDGTIELFVRHFGLDPTAGDGGARSCRPQKCP